MPGRSPTRIGAVLALAGVFLVGGAIYKWVDAEGNVHFGDAPPRGQQAEPVAVEVPRHGHPDEGERRRLELLQEAEQAVRERLAARERQAAEQDAAATARAQRQDECLSARIRLELLRDQRPLYWDDQGALRGAWKYDTYKGPRSYLNYQERAVELARAQARVEEVCDHPDDADEQAAARRQWVATQRCAAARADLEMLQDPASHATGDDVARQEQRVARWCSALQ
jgi:hypothetical protein